MASQKRLPNKHRNASARYDLKVYERLLERVKLLGLGLESSSAELQRARYLELERRGGYREVGAEYKLVAVEKDFFVAQADFELRICDKNGRKRALSIDCSYILYFNFRGDIPRKYLTQFVESNLRLIIWPYFREYVNDITGRMAITPLVVPLSEP